MGSLRNPYCKESLWNPIGIPKGSLVMRKGSFDFGVLAMLFFDTFSKVVFR